MDRGIYDTKTDVTVQGRRPRAQPIGLVLLGERPRRVEEHVCTAAAMGLASIASAASAACAVVAQAELLRFVEIGLERGTAVGAKRQRPNRASADRAAACSRCPLCLLAGRFDSQGTLDWRRRRRDPMAAPGRRPFMRWAGELGEGAAADHPRPAPRPTPPPRSGHIIPAAVSSRPAWAHSLPPPRAFPLGLASDRKQLIGSLIPGPENLLRAGCQVGACRLAVGRVSRRRPLCERATTAEDARRGGNTACPALSCHLRGSDPCPGSRPVPGRDELTYGARDGEPAAGQSRRHLAPALPWCIPSRCWMTVSLRCSRCSRHGSGTWYRRHRVAPPDIFRTCACDAVGDLEAPSQSASPRSPVESAVDGEREKLRPGPRGSTLLLANMDRQRWIHPK